MLVPNNFIGTSKYTGLLLVSLHKKILVMETLQNKVALVTGGSRGIGAAIVKRLAEQGAVVHFTYANGQQKAEETVSSLVEQGLQARAIRADNAVDGEISKVIEGIIEEHGRFDILVNSAGIFLGKPFHEHTMNDFDTTFAVNVRSVTEACLAAAKWMNPNGRIVTIGSGMADKVPFAGATLYTMSKSALQGLTKSLARELGPKEITVNLVQPGSVNTDMNPENSDSADFQRSLMAIPKYGRPAHIAAMVSYLVSEDAAYTTGAVFTIDGGANS
jgi:3-oxoacyl-[acyl-carrier protein] reductase